MSGQPIIVTAELSKTYRRGPEAVHALERVSFELHPGELVALMGPSGSGKTTLLNLIVGWEKADSGSITWLGKDLAPGTELGWDEVGIVPQSLGLLEELSLYENVHLPLRLSHSGTTERVDALLDDLGLGGLRDRFPAEVSLGEQQRTSVARALAREPRLLLADEPTGHQDALWTRGVFKMLRAESSDRMATLVATHNHEVLRDVDRVLGIRDGRVAPVSKEVLQREGH